MEHFELTVNSKENLTLLTKVLMMFSRRRICVVNVHSDLNTLNSISRIRFMANRTDAHRIQMQVRKAVDIFDANLLWIQPAEIQKATMLKVG
jgi:acetolactate synthase regulatory subunit